MFECLNMNRYLKIISQMLKISIVMLFACKAEGELFVTGVSLNKTTLSLEQGSKETLVATITPKKATNKTVSWSSSDNSVATVSTGGELTAVNAGTTTITVITQDGGKRATCDVTVFIPFIAITNIIEVPSTIKTGKPLTLTGEVVPSNASKKTIIWSIVHEGSTGATISDNILNTFVAGYVVIQATIKDGLGPGEDYKQEFIIYVELSGVWTGKADFSGGIRSGAVGFSIGNKGYIGTGGDGIRCYQDFWEYDPVLNSWTKKADFEGGKRCRAVGFSIGNKGYIGTGESEYGNHQDFWEYDPVSNKWTKKADFGGEARYVAVGFSIGSKGYIGTGWNGNDDLQDFWEYDPDLDRWTERVKFPGEKRRLAVGFSIGDKGYLGTGGDYFVDFWEYNPVRNNWTQKENIPNGGTVSAVGFSIGNKGYIGTGYPWGRRDFWEYDPVSNIWIQKADYAGGGREASVGFSIGNKGYMGTGFTYDGGAQNKQDFWEFEP